MPSRLKAETISALMTAVAKGHANSTQLATQGNYRGAPAHYAAKIYSRNIAHRQITASNFPTNASQVDKSPESSENDPPVFSENTRRCDDEVTESEFNRLNPYDWASKLLCASQNADLWKRDKANLRQQSPEEIVF